MKKLLVLVVVVTIGYALYRRLSMSQAPGSAHRSRQHGTPAHWPAVVRKPGTEAPAA